MVHTQPAPRVLVTIPYRGTSPERQANYRLVHQHFIHLLPGVELIEVDSGHEPFNRAATRNECVRHGADHDVIVICDADTLLQQAPLLEAIEQAAVDNLVHNPFSVVRGLTKDSSLRCLVGDHRAPKAAFQLTWAVGTAYVTTPTAWWDIGGMDERFTGWGFEDTAFAIAHRTLKQPMPRHEGMATQLWHPSAPRLGDPHYDAGVEHYARYLAVDGDKAGVAELISG